MTLCVSETVAAPGYFDRAGAAICRIPGAHTEAEALSLLRDASRCIGADASAQKAHILAALPRVAERVLEHVERGDLRLIIDSPDLNVHTRSRFSRPFALRALRRVFKTSSTRFPLQSPSRRLHSAMKSERRIGLRWRRTIR